MTRTTRTDTHRPSVLDPAEYTEVGSFDAHDKDGYYEIDPSAAHLDNGGVHGYHGRCDHCGHSIRYGVIFKHEPTNTIIAVGLTCARTVGLKSLSEKEIKAKAEHHRILKAIAAWKQERPENAEAADYIDAMFAADSENRQAMADWNEQGNIGPAPQASIWYNAFVADVGYKLRRYGSLSEKQVAAILKAKAGAEKYQAMKDAEAAKLAEAAPLAEGRYEITGDVISIKWVEDRYSYDGLGEIKKMLVKMDDGNKVYGSVPTSIYGADRGTRVSFSAKVERSKDDEHFGFFSRPTKASIIEDGS